MIDFRLVRTPRLALALALGGTVLSASATDGYFSHGYGMTAKGMGGAATAMTKDTFGGANNPATMVWVGNRLDLGLDFFSPKRKASRSGSVGFGGPGELDFSTGSDSTMFYIPEFGYNRMLSPEMSLGLTVYGNGGMNTDYKGGEIAAASPTCAGFNAMAGAVAASGPYNALCGGGRLGVDLVQLIIAPTFAMKVRNDHSFGISPLLAHQQFRANGLHGFGGFTAASASGGPSALTNIGRDSSNGWGLRLGWLSRVNDKLAFGASYASRMRMSKFDKYKDLFAGQGDFDIPENWNLGVAFRPDARWTVALDYQRINYAKVRSTGNPSTNLNPLIGPNAGGPFAAFNTPGGTLGCNDCRGFGWGNIDVVKLGVEYAFTKDLTLRAGYNRAQNPIQGRDVTFNILAPGVVQDHLTLGLTYGVSKDSDLTLAYMHARSKSVSGTSLFDTWLSAFGGSGGRETIEMRQNSLGVAWSWKM